MVERQTESLNERTLTVEERDILISAADRIIDESEYRSHRHSPEVRWMMSLRDEATETAFDAVFGKVFCRSHHFDINRALAFLTKNHGSIRSALESKGYVFTDLEVEDWDGKMVPGFQISLSDTCLKEVI